MITSILIFFVVGLVAYAWYTQYSKTPTDQSAAKRMWLSLVAAAGVIVATVASWFHSPAVIP